MTDLIRPNAAVWCMIAIAILALGVFLGDLWARTRDERRERRERRPAADDPPPDDDRVCPLATPSRPTAQEDGRLGLYTLPSAVDGARVTYCDRPCSALGYDPATCITTRGCQAAAAMRGTALSPPAARRDSARHHR